MRILVICDPIIPVPPIGYGGTERIVSYLINELHKRNHDVSMIAATGSKIPGRLITMPDTRHSAKAFRGLAKIHFRREVKREIARHDIVHSVVRLDYALPSLKSEIPKVLHFHNPITAKQVAYVRRHSVGKVVMVPVGLKIMEPVHDDGVWRPIHNGVPVWSYPFVASASKPPYAAFLGRLTRNKGIDTAIDVARRAGVHLKVGGNVPANDDDRRFFEREVEPLLTTPGVSYEGELDDQGKAKLLGGATALLNPIRWDDPCPLVPIESLACGTPVVSFARGELPHLIMDGVTGRLVADGDHEGLALALKEVVHLERLRCRREAEERFDVSRMTDKFEEVYEWVHSVRSDRPGHWKQP